MVISGLQLILILNEFVPRPLLVYWVILPTLYSPTGYLLEFGPLKGVVSNFGMMNCPPWEWPEICKSNMSVLEDSLAKSGSWASKMVGIFSGSFFNTASKLSAQTVQLSTPAILR